MKELQYQNKLTRQIVEEGRRLVVVRYGAGKTKVALTAAKDILGDGHHFVLILCPSHLRRTWNTQIQQLWSQASVLLGDKMDLPISPPLHKTTILLIAIHSLRTKEVQLAALKPDLVILDESTKIANHKTQTTGAALRLAEVWERVPKIALTGDPMPENPTQIWTQLQFCYPNQHVFGKTFYKFLNGWFLNAEYGYVLNNETRDKFYERLDDAMVRMDEADFAEYEREMGCKIKYEVHRYHPAPEQLALLTKLKTDWALPDEGGKDTEYWHTMALLQKRQQIASGFYYQNKNPNIESRGLIFLPHPPKLRLLQELLRGLMKSQSRCVVWHNYQVEHHMLTDAVAEVGWVPVDSPLLLEQEFASPENRTYLCAVIPLSYARGINDLITSSVMIFYSNVYSQEVRNQAESRLPRLGQKAKEVRCIDLCSYDLADSEVVTALQTKNFTPARAETLVKEHIFGVKLCNSCGEPMRRTKRISGQYVELDELWCCDRCQRAVPTSME